MVTISDAERIDAPIEIHDPSAPEPSFADLLQGLDPDGRLVHVEETPPRPGRTAELRRPLPERVTDALGVSAFWSHQAEAIDLVRDHRSVVVATGTASGKSICYQAPIAESLSNPVKPGTALLLFPTKALAQDQARSLADLDLAGLVPACYDGDADRNERSWMRSNASAILTNPEMLHHGLLPNHRRWASFLMRLSHVVVDELHVLRGVFGSHVAHLLRRLRRLCELYGSAPTFVFASATIGEPARLASDLCGLPVTAVTDDGSPRGRRQFALWNPPVLDEHGGRISTAGETARIVSALVRDDRRTIAFCRSRKATELIAADAKRRLPRRLSGAVKPYRGGYLADERREIENELFEGHLRGVVTTSALELGVDIGGLDACVLSGFPGTISSFWQQSGRVGRDLSDSVAVLIGGDDQLDQWLMRHPSEIFTRPPEPAVINAGNPFVLLPHLACAAHEKPLTHNDERFWGDDLHDGVRHLVQADELAIKRRERRGSAEPVAVYDGAGWPSRTISLRSSSAVEYTIVRAPNGVDPGGKVGTVDGDRAFSLIHPGAVYLHRGTSYEVTDLDATARQATVTWSDDDVFTRPRSSTDISILQTDETIDVGGALLHRGAVEVSTQVTGYQRLETRSQTVLSSEPLDLPPSRLVTRAIWYTIPGSLAEAAFVDGDPLPGTLHAIEHGAIGMLPLFTICDRWDVGGVSTARQHDTGLPTIFIYDGYPGGAGIAELVFDAADRHLAATLDAIESCRCEFGCPSCVQSPKCGNGNDPLDKAGAVRLLRTVLDD